jgi:DNA-directed RNA polymerase specialized sigma24 family protein
VLPHQASAAEEVTSDDAASTAALAQLLDEISQELRENRDRLRRSIYSLGYREPDLSALESETQVRYYRARLKPGFTLRYGDPLPFLRKCFYFAQMDFHRGEGRAPKPVEEVPEPKDDTPSAMEGVSQGEALMAFLEQHLPHEGQRRAWLMAYVGEMGSVEIAHELGIDRGTATSWAKKAEAHLRSLPPDDFAHLR